MRDEITCARGYEKYSKCANQNCQDQASSWRGEKDRKKKSKQQTHKSAIKMEEWFPETSELYPYVTYERPVWSSHKDEQSSKNRATGSPTEAQVPWTHRQRLWTWMPWALPEICRKLKNRGSQLHSVWVHYACTDTSLTRYHLHVLQSEREQQFFRNLEI